MCGTRPQIGLVLKKKRKENSEGTTTECSKETTSEGVCPLLLEFKWMNFPTKQSETAVVDTQRKEENDRPTRQLTNEPEGARKC